MFPLRSILYAHNLSYNPVISHFSSSAVRGWTRMCHGYGIFGYRHPASIRDAVEWVYWTLLNANLTVPQFMGYIEPTWTNNDSELVTYPIRFPVVSHQISIFERLNHPVGGETAPAFWAFWKKCRFHHSETTDSFPKISLKFPREFEVVFWWWPVIYKEFVPEKVRGVFFHLTSPYGSSRRDQWAPKDFWSWSSSNAIDAS